MSAVLLAVFRNPADAEQVRAHLVKDGFPTDRVELSARATTGQVALQPAATAGARLEQYFRTVLGPQDGQALIAALIEQVEAGAATITVQPRGDIETRRALEILEHAGAAEVLGRDLDQQGFEHAAATSEHPWVRYLTGADPEGAPRRPR
ncbi:MAG TPA: hypothetical protein VK695_04360 [Steroidobacteraceae bacterium]|jgi:hypothetical protein|nr:hypothetical protein [Steroidobacteraceae bacterium]